MTIDLSSMLKEWPYEPGQINVRLVEGEDGTPKVQMRLDLGILQLETVGRPDGQRPQGYDSLLDLHEARIDAARDEAAAAGEVEEGDRGEGESRGDSGDAEESVVTLSEEDCRALREEAVQYYHRYISLLVLGDYDGVVRDCARNLRVMDLCRDHAESEEDQQVLEQFRSYVLMMRTRALATQMVTDDEPKAALFVLDDGIEQIRRVYSDAGRGEEFEESSEVQLLRGMRDELGSKLPASPRAELRDRLAKALEQENYELAAILRDELKMMKEG
ncbi:MAG TPA: hypothetical protein DEB06_07060 [Phycisphaerales bacterium]|nr:hypothetical protein [Phycisphaerales bacterium]